MQLAEADEVAVLEIRAGEFQAALARLDKLVQSQLASPQVLLLRAEALAASGQMDRAEADALRAFDLLANEVRKALSS